MNIVIFSNAPIKKITEALNLPFSPKEGWVSAAIAMLQTVECNIFYVFPQRKTKEVIKGKIDNIQYYGYPKTKRYDWEFEESHQRIFEEILKDIPQINVIHIMGTEYGHSLSAVLAAEECGLIADIIELLPTPEQESDLRNLMGWSSESYRFATAEEIISLGIDTNSGDLRETIADHTTKIIQENEGKLIKNKSVGKIYSVTV